MRTEHSRAHLIRAAADDPLPARGGGAGIGGLPGSQTWYSSWGAFSKAYTPTHELGHNLGLGHSQTVLASGAVVPYGARCPRSSMRSPAHV